MTSDPHPRELPRARGFDEGRSEAVRNVFCAHYATCLSNVVRAGWDDWTCAECPLRTATPAPSATRFAEDRHPDPGL